MPRPSKGFKLRMDLTGPSFDILRSHASRLNIACVLIGWQLPTRVYQSFTLQIRVYQHEKVAEKVSENRGKFYLSPTVCQRVCRLFCSVHTHQLEFANTSLPTLVWRVKVALRDFPQTKLDSEINAPFLLTRTMTPLFIL